MITDINYQLSKKSASEYKYLGEDAVLYEKVNFNI